MQKTFSTLCLSLAISCGSVTLSILPSTSFAAAINFQQILQQERAWAGLQSKQVKVENVICSDNLQRFFLKNNFKKQGCTTAKR